jgi:DNA-binding YbaB/EbfC family protein
MFEFFRNMSQMAGLMRNLPKIQEEMARLQANLAQITAEGDAGAGMVKARANGKLEVTGLTICDEALQSGDREMLEDLVRAAVNQALNKAREAVGAETARMGASLGLPAGMKLPGMG